MQAKLLTEESKATALARGGGNSTIRIQRLRETNKKKAIILTTEGFVDFLFSGRESFCEVLVFWEGSINVVLCSGEQSKGVRYIEQEILNGQYKCYALVGPGD